MTDILSISNDIVIPQDFTDDKLTLVQVMIVAFRQQAITWTSDDIDLRRHMAPLGYNELIHWIQCIYA